MRLRALLFCVFLSLSVFPPQRGNTQVLAPEEGREAGGTDNDCVVFTTRFSDVVLIPGRRLKVLLGQSIPGIRLMAWKDDRWDPVPFQIDEKGEEGEFLFPYGDENDQDKLDHKLDSQDELIFMARDVACRAAAAAWPIGHAKAEEIEVTDPLTGEKGWLYLFSFPEPPSLSPVDLVRYDPDYDRVHSEYYISGYSRIKNDQKAVMEYYSVPPEAGGTGVNWFDSAKIWTRIRLFFSLFPINIHSDDWVSWVPAYVDGPIRVIIKKRTAIKLGFGLHTPTVEADLVYYPHLFVSAVVIAIPFNPSIVTSSLKITIGTDLNHLATGMMFWNSENPDPVIVDGRMSPQEIAMDLSPDRWRVISGAQGKYMGKAVYGGNFKLSNIKLDEGRYVDDYMHKEPPENEHGIFGSYNWTWDITKGKRGSYVVWMEAHYGPAIGSEEDLKYCLDVTDNPLLVRVGPKERFNCLLIPPPGFTEDVLPAIFREARDADQNTEESEVVPEQPRNKRGKGYGRAK
jgi:hypothetical protein